MDADNHSFLLVLSPNAHFTVGHGRIAIRLPGRITTAAAISTLGAHMTPSSAANAASLGKPFRQSCDKWPSWPQL
jgi:hypothetical protein